jgi:3'-phosphoadenosine 5'-phosphosulfate (PAPS) 3'-phosphatase
MVATSLRFTHLLRVTKDALDIVQPLIKQFYISVNTDSKNAIQKHDLSLFSIADGCVEELFKNFLFQSHMCSLVGEEASSYVNIQSRPYKVIDLTIPSELWDQIDLVRTDIEKLSQELEKFNYKDVEVFIDPIDGTREFCTGLGEQCTVCVGFAINQYPVAGIVYRPITEQVEYAMGCYLENFTETILNKFTVLSPPSHFLTTNGTVSPFLREVIKHLNFKQLQTGGVGNKALLLLENRGECYIVDRGVSRWDTCASQAILEAHGGVLAKLTTFIRNGGELQSYKYTQSTQNTDFEADIITLSVFNQSKKAGPGPFAVNVTEILPYINACGTIAFLDRSKIPIYHSALTAAKNIHLPKYE